MYELTMKTGVVDSMFVSLWFNSLLIFLSVQYWPHSIQMVELMTWCWSDNPNHRPSFDQILSILRSDSSYSLVGGTPVSRDDEIHAACVKTVAVRRRSLASTINPSLTTTTTSLAGPSCTRMTSVISPRLCGIGMETVVDVWYSTITGKLSVVRYHSTGSSVEVWQNGNTIVEQASYTMPCLSLSLSQSSTHPIATSPPLLL